MPKEITHWLVARKVSESARGTQWGDVAMHYPNALGFGAVFPDLLYYITGPTIISRYRSIAQAYHGAHGEDTNELPRSIAAVLSKCRHVEALRAFLYGLVCHIQTDLTFHPLVYALTGNDEDNDPNRRTQSVKDHRRFECLIDLYFCDGPEGLAGHSLQRMIRNLELPLSCLWSVLEKTNTRVADYPAMASAMKSALLIFSILQNLFRRKLPSRVLQAAMPHLTRSMQEVAALFYTQDLLVYMDDISGPLSFRNASGIVETITLTELFNRAVAQSLKVIDGIDQALGNGLPILPEVGPPLGCHRICDYEAGPLVSHAASAFFRSDG
ncbi:MAG: hypothetical protein CSYNP_02609 [Syntrophus sp. SKADARSKE-3]|nr:hypothetical protein [Syntrophus sp. SKADARSKE-3]